MNRADGSAGDHTRRVVVGTLQYLLAAGLSLPTGLLTAAFLGRVLGPADYGLLTVAGSIIGLVEVVVNMGFGRTTVKFIAEAEDWLAEGGRIARAHLLLALLAMALVMVLAPLLAHWLDAPRLTAYLRLYALDIPLFALWHNHLSILTGRGDSRRRAVLAGLYWTVRLVLILALVGAGLSVLGAILASIGTSAIVLVVARFFVRPPLLSRAPGSGRSLWNFTAPLIINSVSHQLFNRLDLMLVKSLVALPQATGFYGATQNLTAPLGLLPRSYGPLLLGRLSHLWGQGQKQAAAALGRQTLRLILATLPLGILALGAAPEIVVLVYGAAFAPAATLLQWLIAAALGASFNVMGAATLTALGRPKLVLAINAPLVPLALLGHLLAIPRYGAEGAAAVTALLTWLNALVAMTISSRLVGMRPPLVTLLRSGLIGAALYALAANWPTPGFLVLVKLLLGVLAAPLAFLLLGELAASEKDQVRSWWRQWRSGTGATHSVENTGP